MKKIYLCNLVAAVLIGPIALLAGPSQKLRVFTMNLHCYEDHWEFRFRHILNFVLEISPDVISFQEVCTEPQQNSSQIAFIANYLKEHHYPIRSIEEQYTHSAWDRYEEYLLTLSKHSASRISKGLLPPSLLQRGYIGLLIGDRWYVNSHLEFRQDNAPSRREQVEFLMRQFSPLPQIMMGDFNSAPDSPEQKPFWDAHYTPVFPDATFIGVDDNGKNRIDGFWLSSLYINQVAEYTGTVVLKEKVNDQHLSDHFGVLLQLSLNRK